MLVTRKQQAEEWLPVMGAEVLFAPIDRVMLRKAKRAALAVDSAAEDPDGEDAIESMGDALSLALIMAGVRDWRNVAIEVDADGEVVREELPFSPENLAMVLDDPVTFDAFDEVYVVPFVSREREKNGSAVSPNGIGEAETQEIGTAISPAADSSGATPAPTASTSRKPKKPRSSGKS